MTNSSHDEHSTVPVEAILWYKDDPDLALIHADMDAWLLAHPCECEALCTCD